MKKINLMVLICIITSVSVFANQKDVSTTSMQYFTSSNQISKNDITNYSMSNEQKSDMFFWIALGTTIAGATGFLLSIPAIGMLAGGTYEMANGVYYVGSNVFDAGAGLLAFSQFLFWNGLFATIPMWILYAHFAKKADKSTIFDPKKDKVKKQRAGFDIIATPESIGGYLTVRF